MTPSTYGWTLSALLLVPATAVWSAQKSAAPAKPARPQRAAHPAPAGAAPRPVQAAANPPAAVPPASAPAGVPIEPAPPGSEERIRSLETLVEKLQQRIEQLEKSQPSAASPAAPENAAPQPAPALAAPAAPEAPAPAETPAPAEAAPPAETPAPAETPTEAPSTGGGATLLPNISGIGDFKFAGGNRKGTEGRGRFALDEFEIGLQDRVAPDIRVDAFLSSERGEAWKTGVEEAYLTWTNPLGIKSLSTRIGKLRTPFGKQNPLHPHTWLYVTQPSAIAALLSPDGLNSDGIQLQYLLPIGGNFLNLELGRWETTSEAADGRGFAGGQKGAYSGRLWFGKEVGRDSELEFGLSHYRGRGDVAGFGRPRLAVTGLDFTYRNYPSAYQRLLLQGELIQHSTGGFSSHRRFGGYLTLAKRFSQYYEAGLRGDYTRFPFPTPGHESAASFFLTRFITEATAVRLELRHGARPDDGGFNEAWLQILTGFGPHSHNLQ